VCRKIACHQKLPLDATHRELSNGTHFVLSTLGTKKKVALIVRGAQNTPGRVDRALKKSKHEEERRNEHSMMSCYACCARWGLACYAARAMLPPPSAHSTAHLQHSTPTGRHSTRSRTAPAHSNITLKKERMMTCGTLACCACCACRAVTTQVQLHPQHSTPPWSTPESTLRKKESRAELPMCHAMHAVPRGKLLAP